MILIPIYNDWESFAELATGLDAELARHDLVADILIVDDGSVVEPGDLLARRDFRAIGQVEVLVLRRNLGHQRAIAVGLAYLEDRVPCEAVVVMDGDGEDAPSDVPRLVDRLRQEGGRMIIFAERTKRSESPVFRVGYVAYKALHVLLTGQKVRVGNFSAIPRRRLESLVGVSELWNHYAAAAFVSRQPYTTIPTHRALRLRGRSSMNFVSLVVHGLSAISVFSAVVGVRLLLVTFALAVAALSGIVATFVVRLSTDRAIPGWATSTAGLLLIILFQALMMAFTISFVLLGNRQGAAFLPRRDYVHFVGGTYLLLGRQAAAGAMADRAWDPAPEARS